MKKISRVLVPAVLVVGLAGTVRCTSKIPAGYAGVVYNMNGGISDEVLGQGWHIVSPTKKITEYSVGMEQSYLTKGEKGDSEKNDSFNITTSDGKKVNVDLEFSYSFNPDTLATTFTRFKGQDGETIKDTFIKPKMIAWSQEVTAKYPVTAVFGDKRAEINAELDNYLKEKFSKYGIVIDTVNFTRIDPDSKTAEAIQKKVNAQQELETTRVQAETASVNAQKDKEVAEINAQTQIIEAEAAAKANKVIADSLTSELVESKKIDKWDGVLPKVSSGNSIVDVRESEK